MSTANGRPTNIVRDRIAEADRDWRPKPPLPGRMARICTECNERRFGEPDWNCPRHPRKTVRQRNHPYFKQPIPD
jgi:hypothetical protein